MKKSDVQKLHLGIYKIFWKDGGSSVAAVGVTENGDRWLAPTNWLSPAKDQKCWRMVDEAYLIGDFKSWGI